VEGEQKIGLKGDLAAGKIRRGEYDANRDGRKSEADFQRRSPLKPGGSCGRARKTWDGKCGSD
jgi:hypothetical protein